MLTIASLPPQLRPSGTGGVEVGDAPKSSSSAKPSAQSLGHRGISNLDNFIGDTDSKSTEIVRLKLRGVVLTLSLFE